MTSAASASTTPRPIQTGADTPCATVCQLVHGLPIGGAEVLIDRIIRRLRDRYRFVVACLDEIGQLGEQLADEGVHVLSLDRRPGFDWRSARHLQHWLRDEEVHIVHAHQCTPFAYALATRAFGRRPPILLTEHGRFYPDLPSRKRKLLHRLLTRSDDRFIAVGKTVRTALVENEGLPAERIQVVYNGIDPSGGYDGAIDREKVRAEYALSDETCLVVQVARLDTIKDHGTALKAIKIASGRDPRIHLFIVGDGPQRCSIEREIANHSLQPRVTMLGMRSDVRRLLAAADIFLLTSLSEGIPVTVLEAMAAGVPVVATAVGGLPEVIQNQESGCLAPAGDATALADAILRMAGDKELRVRLAQTAQHSAAADFGEQTMIASYDHIYQEMLACCTNS